jgi:hypothetical protein
MTAAVGQLAQSVGFLARGLHLIAGMGVMTLLLIEAQCISLESAKVQLVV